MVKTIGKKEISEKLSLTPLASAPSTPAEGDVYYDSTDGLKVYNGSGWSGASEAGVPMVIIDDSDDLDFSTSRDSFGSASGDEQKTYNITSEQLQNKKYIVLEVLGRFYTSGFSLNGRGGCNISFTLTKDPEGTPVVLATQNVASSNSDGSSDRCDRDRMVNNTVKHYYTITEDDRSNGINLELKMSWSHNVTATSTTLSTSFANRQIVFSLI